ncbi:23S rRNA (Uracil-5-) -methyltransferase RumA [Serinicoccus hydrothermalis]|uniref:23S rRNA (Uracil-5-) -methyltransferase RumA n=1 Tax=Serinicoccus hydrothermalis TaxID=1758689 RepID=A0A1B1N969_9MICO|nr:23S rRNA (Uracil-5-) -methyltransferase RumA [Serinicoccus hydrothermalis]
MVGDELDLLVGPVAHGGHCVARVGDADDGLVVFVRHALPGERVRVRVTGTGGGGRFLRADAVAVHEASPDRVQPPCPFSGPGRCGGCDWQHADLDAQRRLKAQVVTEQLARVAGLDEEEILRLGGGADLVCEPVPGDERGLRWRTRVEVALHHVPGRPPVSGLRAHRSHHVVDVDDCRIAAPGVAATGAFTDPASLVPATHDRSRRADVVTALDVVAPAVGEPVVVLLAAPGQGRPRGGRGGRPASRRGSRRPPAPLGPVPEVTERVGGHDFTVSARGFWQVHPGAAATFTEQVLDWLDPRPGDSVLDLYAGVGLFAVPLSAAVGPDGRVLAVEADEEATRSAGRNLGAYPWAEAVAEPTASALGRLVAEDERVDLVVLDPPRSGAGAEVVRDLAALGPRAVVYVACDPAALARDVATAREAGLELEALRVLDAFPMTHHVECLALLRPAAPR